MSDLVHIALEFGSMRKAQIQNATASVSVQRTEKIYTIFLLAVEVAEWFFYNIYYVYMFGIYCVKL